jgi:hypothetical protein
MPEPTTSCRRHRGRKAPALSCWNDIIVDPDQFVRSDNHLLVCRRGRPIHAKITPGEQLPAEDPFSCRRGTPFAPDVSKMLKNSFSVRLLKKVQMQDGEPGTHPSGWVQVRGVLRTYAAAPRERANAADGPFSAAC